MAKLFGREYTQEELLTRVGDISQLGGVQSIILDDGSARGVRAAEFRTGTGLHFRVLLDRGMDISAADFCGTPLCWRSATGDVAPAFYEPEGLGWLRSFYGGLMVTCGLTHIGAPDVDEGKALGLHDRISNIPVQNVYMDGDWDGDDYVMWVQGKVRQTAVFQENLMLRRKIWTRLGENRIFVDDVVENVGYDAAEHMMLYHINGGFPVIDGGTEMVAPFVKTHPRDTEAEIDREKFSQFQEPTPGFKERVYYHDVVEDEQGYVYSALVNKSFNNGQGFGLYVKYIKEQLPVLVEWKMNGQGVYVVGMEPATNWANGRSIERKEGRLKYLEAGQSQTYNLEIGVLSGVEEIAELEDKIQTITS